MRLALTGTPGTGKTTAARQADVDLRVIHLTQVIQEANLSVGTDPARDTLVADLDGLRDRFADVDDVLFESHLAHELDADRVVVLRCHPDELRRRLRDRGWAEKKIEENVESEELDVILGETVDRHGTDQVFEVDTTDRTPAAVAREVAAVAAGDREPGVGKVDFLDR